MNLSRKQTLALGLVTVLLAGDLLAQRGRRRFRRERSAPASTTPPPAPKAANTEVKNHVAITGGTVYIGTGQVLRDATVLIGDDKILEVGPGIEIPKQAKIIDAKGKYVSPGFVITSLRGLGSGSTSDNPADSVNPFDPQMKMGLAAGITSFLNASGGGSSPSGNSAVFKCAWGDISGMVLMHGNVMKMSVPLSMSQMKSLRDNIEKARKFRDARNSGTAAAKPGAKPAAKPPASSRGRTSRRPSSGSSPSKPPSGTEKYVKIMDGKVKLWIGCRRGFANDNIRQAMQIAKLLGVGVVLEDPVTAWSIPDEVAATGSMVLLSPRTIVRPDPAHPKTTGSNIAMARILAEVGVPVAVHPPAGRFGGGGLGTGGILGQDLNTPHVDAAYAVRGGLDNRKALRTLTLDAARMMGAEARIGSLEPGKDADVLILDGKPLHYRTFVETAIVNGKIVYEKDKEPFYNHIKR